MPTAYRQDTTTGAWRRIDTRSDEGLDLAYSPETLVTALDGRSGYQVAVSSSTKPDLMVRMLQILDIHDGHRVLEIGTGTGYNAALLTHRLGHANVFSVDIDAELIDAARGRLARIGYRPTLVAVDGVSGLPEHAPYDRIIVTCSVPTVPRAWAEQLASDGHLLLDLKIGRSARVEGRVTEAGPTPLWAAVEQAHHQWITFGEPDWPRFGVTATSGRQWIWLDEAENPIATLSR